MSQRRNYRRPAKKHNFAVYPRRNESVDRLVRRFIKKTKKLGIIEEAKERRHYIKPSEQRRIKKAKAEARRKKELKKARK